MNAVTDQRNEHDAMTMTDIASAASPDATIILMPVALKGGAR